MEAYAKEYLSDVVENQGNLFDLVSQDFPNKDTADFITKYMLSKTRKYIDAGQAYVNTMSVKELWDFFCKEDNYSLVDGQSLQGFMPNWIGQFHAYYQWYYNISSNEVINKVPLSFLIKAYPGLHDLDLDLAVKKVGCHK